MRRAAAILLLLVTGPAVAVPPVVTSAAPDSVGVTLYRDPDRETDEPLDPDFPTSFALITEQRTVTLPPGDVVVRFEGVASGIVPQSAILFGTAPRERNRDAALLSQRGLVDAFTGQQVILRRTDPATGLTVEEPATVRSAADRLVLTTPRGVEAVYCSGLRQTVIYPEAPAELSARPVLSMTTKDQPGGVATITLAYLATGFDWEATYVGTLAPDGRSLALLGWLTMASSDDTSFVDATTAAVAGRVNRSDETQEDAVTGDDAEALYVTAGCWPAGTTTTPSDLELDAPPPMAMAMGVSAAFDEVVVTTRMREAKLQGVPLAMTAVAESLGDLKLYRIPEPVTVAARSQKQVAFLAKERVAGQLVYRAGAVGGNAGAPEVLFRFYNRKADGLGDPLPAGQVVLYQEGRAGRMLVGETSVSDRTVDEEVELVLDQSTQVTLDDETRDLGKRGREHRLTVRNANPYPVRFELEFYNDIAFAGLPRGLVTKPGKRVWAKTIPANGTERVEYRERAMTRD